MSRCLSPFTVHGKQPNPVMAEAGSGVYVFRNILDLREGTYRTPPDQPDPTRIFLNSTTTLVAHDHGGPTHAVYYLYQNTFLLPGDAFRDYYAFAWGSHTRGTTRRVFNNIFVQVDVLPGLNFAGTSPDDDFEANGNLLWGLTDGPNFRGDFFEAARRLPWFEASKRRYPPGWGAGDVFANPQFVSADSGKDQPVDLRLREGSPAIDAGVELPGAWPDPFKTIDDGKPDVGALPHRTTTLENCQGEVASSARLRKPFDGFAERLKKKF
jgi:hypothetical protein